jgi:hypothetical protein
VTHSVCASGWPAGGHLLIVVPSRHFDCASSPFRSGRCARQAELTVGAPAAADRPQVLSVCVPACSPACLLVCAPSPLANESRRRPHRKAESKPAGFHQLPFSISIKDVPTTPPHLHLNGSHLVSRTRVQLQPEDRSRTHARTGRPAASNYRQRGLGRRLRRQSG